MSCSGQLKKWTTGHLVAGEIENKQVKFKEQVELKKKKLDTGHLVAGERPLMLQVVAEPSLVATKA